MVALSRFGFGQLPGDLSFRAGGISCFVPIVSMILLSVILTVVLNLAARFLNR